MSVAALAPVSVRGPASAAGWVVVSARALELVEDSEKTFVKVLGM